MRFMLPLIVAAIIVAVDQITKISAFSTRSIRSGFEVPGIIEPVRHANAGLVANLPVPLWLIIGLTFFIVLGGLILIAREIKMREAKIGNRQAILALGILLGGALGNLIDRVWLGYVRDWILLFGQSAINLADVAIALGLLWYSLVPRPSTINTGSSSATPSSPHGQEY